MVTLEERDAAAGYTGHSVPKFEDQRVGLYLAFCGSIRDEILDTQDLAFELIKVLEKRYPESLQNRYKLDEIQEETLDNMEAIAFKRGFLMPGKRIDYERTGRTVIDEFRSGKLGRITLERCRRKESRRMTKQERLEKMEQRFSGDDPSGKGAARKGNSIRCGD